MTNREWVIKQMQNMSDEEFAEAIKVPDEMDRVTNCSLQECEQFEDCNVCVAKWLKAEHKEKPKLSEAERVILENIGENWKWIARGEFEGLWVYRNKPTKEKHTWQEMATALKPFNHLFQFIKWEDEEAYEISELLK